MSESDRRHERESVKFNLLFEDGEHFDVATVENVSEGGLFLRTAQPLPPGSEIVLIPLGAAEDLMPEVKARVVWRAPLLGSENQYGMGVEFLDFCGEMAEHLDHICRTYGLAA